MNIIKLFFVVGLLIQSCFIAGVYAYENSENEYQKILLVFHQPKIIDEGEYVTIELVGANSKFIQNGYYIVPTYIETILFKFGTKIYNIDIKLGNEHIEKINKKLNVVPTPRLNGMIDYNDIPIKNINSGIIHEWYKYDIGMGINRNERCVLVKIQVFPIQYQPYENTIKWTENFEIEIEYTRPKTTICSVDEQYNFLVLTPTEFTEELTDLITHKNSRGISTKLVTLDEIYTGVYFNADGRDNPEKIKYFIKNAYDHWETSSILLVGSSNEFPTRETHVFVDYQDGDNEIFVSDLYYADIYNESLQFCSWDSNGNNVFGEFNWSNSNLYDFVDLYPDVHLGRIACVNEDQVEILVDKIITYETSDAYTQEWFTELILCGGDTFPGDTNTVDEGEYICDIIEENMTGFTSTKLYASNGGLISAANMRNTIKQGASFLILSGHANPGSWATHPHENEDIWLPPFGFTNVDASSCINKEKLPILLTDSCSPFKFNLRDDCIGWSFMANSNGGCIGGFGASGLSWGNDGTDVAQTLTSKLMLDTINSYIHKGAITLGDMWSTGINTFLYPDMDGGNHKSIEEWQPFGDPTLAIAKESQPPLKPNIPDGPTSSRVNQENTYSTSTIDPDDDHLYYLFNWDDNQNSGWIGPYDSSENVQASHTWTEAGNYEIKVKAKDQHGVQSQWSDTLNVNVTKGKIKREIILPTFQHNIIYILRELFNIMKYYSEQLTHIR